MTVKLNAATGGGSVSLSAPNSTTSNADVTLTLPPNDGDASQYLQTDGAGALSWQTVTTPLFESYAIICDQKTNGTDGGSYTADTTITRNLNTELVDPDGIVSISSNQFTLGAGNYYIHFAVPAIRVQTFTAWLYDVTNTTDRIYGQAAYSYVSDGDTSNCHGYGRVSITANTTYEIRFLADNSLATYGLGRASESTSYSGPEIYTIVEIYKEA